MRLLTLVILGLVLVCCDKKPMADSSKKAACATDTAATAAKKFDMYTLSEMSLLMEQMYVDNERLRDRIMKGDTIGAFPNHFLKIHKAVMTDEKENDAFFKEHSAKFISAQELIYSDPANAKKHYNNSINACIACHEVKCGGPITRIRKLYIK